MNPSFLYRFLKAYTTLGLHFYFRTWQITGKEKIPPKGPLIFIANHQNAFMDAILMTCSASRNPYYLARANVFKKPLAAKVLSLLHLKPIYRFRDGFSTLKNNDIIMQDCINLMKKGEVVLLFPEANHNEPWSIREFQKGFARMAMMYWQQTKDTSLKIVPFGIHYTEHCSFNGRVLINVGEPLSVTSIVTETRTERENLEAIVKAGEAAIKELVLDIKPESDYNERQKHLIQNRVYETDMYHQLLADKKVTASFPESSKKPVVENKVLKFLVFPFNVYLYLTHGLPYLWLSRFVKQKIKDAQFITSVKFAIGVFAVPAYYTVLAVVFYIATKDVFLTILFFASLPVSLLVTTKANLRK
jgi:1-acyl-sn-glycerol-3-phosphate acyltransferase